jgi:hypothetical protein
VRRELAGKYPKRADVQADLARSRADTGELAQAVATAALGAKVPPEKARSAAEAARNRIAMLAEADPDNAPVKAALGRLESFLTGGSRP